VKLYGGLKWPFQAALEFVTFALNPDRVVMIVDELTEGVSVKFNSRTRTGV
jgi:hypothetical protein